MIPEINSVFSKKRGFEGELQAARKGLRAGKPAIDPQVIFKQAQLIKLKREAKELRARNVSFKKVERAEPGDEAENHVGVVAGREVKGYYKCLPNPFNPDCAILEKIRWDLALLIGDGECHTPTEILYVQAGIRRGVGSLQVHQEGVFLEYKAAPVDRRALLRALVTTIAYGGFDDHLGNQIYSNNKVIFYDNASSFSNGMGFINDGGDFYRFSFRPKVLELRELDEPLTQGEVAFLARELNKYLQSEQKVKNYFARPDVKKLLSHMCDGVFDPEEALEGIQERVAEAVNGLEVGLTPVNWVFNAFPLYRIAIALALAAEREDPFNAVGYTCMKEIINDLEVNAAEVLNIALSFKTLEEIQEKIIELPTVDMIEKVRGIHHALDFIEANTVMEYKDREWTPKMLADFLIPELEENEIKFTRNEDHTLTIGRLGIIPAIGEKMIMKFMQFQYPPMTVEEFIAFKNDQISKEIADFERFMNFLVDESIPVHSLREHEIGKVKVAMPFNSYLVFQILDRKNTRFILTERDEKGTIFSREIGMDKRPILRAKRRYSVRIVPILPRPIIAEAFVNDDVFKVRPGDCVGTYVIQVGKLELAPMYAEEMARWIQGSRRELGLLKELNHLNTQDRPLLEGEHVLIQEKEAAPMKFTLKQRARGTDHIAKYTVMGPFRRGLWIISESGSFMLDQKTFFEKLKDGSALQ